jgi:5-methylcytosine-specific restriction enzyme A
VGSRPLVVTCVSTRSLVWDGSTMAIPPTSRAQLLAALTEFDRTLRDAPEWRDWQGNRNYEWALVHGDREYPVKQIIEMATGYPRSEFSGGPEANAYVERLGFSVRHLHDSSRTRASRNPKWARDELILALDLYLRHGLLDDRHPEVIELSRVLNTLPIHTVRPDAEKFRNPNGVALKLANFAAIDPNYHGAGMARGGQRDAEVWHRYANDRPTLARLAADLRAHATGAVSVPVVPEEDEDEVEEGRIKFREHRARERNAALISRKKRHAMAKLGRLACEVCGFDFLAAYGTLGHGFMECHHVVPLSVTGHTITTLRDLALVCPNCHRMLHRARPWLSLDQLRTIQQAQREEE